MNEIMVWIITIALILVVVLGTIIADFLEKKEPPHMIIFNDEEKVVEGDLRQVKDDCILLMNYLYKRKIKQGYSKIRAKGFLMDIVIQSIGLEENDVEEKVSIQEKLSYTE